MNRVFSFRTWMATVLLAVAAIPSSRADVTPLAFTKDAVGEALQRTMIWGPPGDGSANFVAFRKKFVLPSAVRKAELHLFADIRYLVWINGQYVLRGPARFEPTGPEYDSLDVIRFLKPGPNAIVVLVMGNASNGKMRTHAPGLTASLAIDGKPFVTTDATWKWSDQTRYRPAGIEWGNCLDHIDARVEDGDWTQPDYNDVAWKPSAAIAGDQWGPLTARRAALLRETPVPITFGQNKKLPVTLRAGEKLELHLGRLVQAYTALELEADAGTELSLDYAGIPYIARAGRQTYLSSDTHGFADGSITVKSGRAKIVGLKIVERLYPFEVVGSFHSSDPLLDKLWSVCARSLQVMSEDSYVDCADRERTEWMDNTPPCFDITRTAMAGPGENGAKIYGDPRLLESLLRRIALTLQPDGWVKAHTCSDRFDIHAKMEDRACDWVQGARIYYESTGNAAPIREIWPVIVRQMDYFLERRTPRGLVRAREWVFSGNPVAYLTAEGAGLNAFVYKALVDAAYLGDIIGEKSTAEKFAQASRELNAAFNKVLWDEKEGTYYSGYYADEDQKNPNDEAKKMGMQKKDLPKVENNLLAPTMYPALWALDQGLVPQARRARVTQYLMDHRQQAEPEQWLMSYYYLFGQMYAANKPAFDTEILGLFRTKWKGMAESSWQTTWEHMIDGSRAHCYGMFPGYFLSAYVLGVRPDGPASNRRLLIDPRLGDLQFAEGSVVTEFGPVPVSWKKSSGSLTFQLTVPAGVKAFMRLPATNANGHLTLDGNIIAAKGADTQLVLEVGPGVHKGLLTGLPGPPLLPH